MNQEPLKRDVQSEASLTSEETLRRALTKAQREYTRTSEIYHLSLQDFDDGALPHPDGHKNVQNAYQEMMFAMREYRRALDAFSEFILTGRKAS